MPRLTLSLLGAFHAELDGKHVGGFESNKVRAPLAYLAVEASRAHRRETLATLLWPDASNTIALTNLRNALADLRQLLHDRDAGTPIVLINHDSIQLNPRADVWVDVWEFEGSEKRSGISDQRSRIGDQGVAIRNQQSAINNQQSTIRNLQSAIALYRGPFLEGFSVPDSAPFEEWITLKREQLGQHAIRRLRRLADFHEACGVYDQARSYAQRQVELEPWLEEAHRQLMRIEALSGQRSAALAQYETCKRLLADELGIEPADETTRLYQVILEGREDEIRGAELLPAPGSPPFKGLQYFDEADIPLFFGRQSLTARLVEQVHAMINGEAQASHADTRRLGSSGDGSPMPLLAVVGPSGYGKSSLVRAGLVPADFPAPDRVGRGHPGHLPARLVIRADHPPG
jgi:DNA-binding SARP family transcriptional activator